MAGRREGFGALLRRFREEAGYSQEALAERAGLSANAISALERGERKRPYPDTTRRLADALDLDERDRTSLVTAVSRHADPVRAVSNTPAAGETPLPAEPTPLIGRDREIDVVRHLLLHGGGRPLTLTGPGGVGKTRLALHVARDVAGHYPDGVCWVELAPVGEPEGVLPAIARAVGLEESLSDDPATALRGHLSGRQTLLVLDNLEHLLEAANEIATLLGACPDIGLLVTSRAPLNIRGEQEYMVPPLELPTASAVQEPSTMAMIPAVELFMWQARQKDPDFELTRENAADVAAICRRLDGVPLALDLAAARVKVLGTAELRARLDRVLPVLTGGPRDAPARQRTMESTIRWSHDLLHPPERVLLRRLAVFAGGWTLDAAESVAGEPGIDLLEGITALVEQSLVRQVIAPGGQRRFAMLETLRQFGMARLVEAGEDEAIQARHLDWCVGLAEAAEQGLAGPAQAAWLDRLEAEHDNLRAALGSTSERMSETRLRLAGALWRFWWWHGHLTEGRTWLVQVLASGTPDRTAWRAKALMAAGILARDQGDYGHANAMLEESLSIRRALDDRRGTAQSLNILGLVAMNQGRLREAIELYEEALGVYREEYFPLGIAMVLNNMASTRRDMGDFHGAATLYEETSGIYRDLGEQRGLALTLHNLGRVKRDLGELDVASDLFERSMAIEEALGDRLNMAMTIHNMGRVASDRGEVARAAALYAESLLIRKEFGDRLGCIKVTEDVAALASTLEPETAATLHGAAQAARASLGAPVPPADRVANRETAERIRDALGTDSFDEAVRHGRTLDAEQMVDEALAFLLVAAQAPVDA